MTDTARQRAELDALLKNEHVSWMGTAVKIADIANDALARVDALEAERDHFEREAQQWRQALVSDSVKRSQKAYDEMRARVDVLTEAAQRAIALCNGATTGSRTHTTAIGDLQEIEGDLRSALAAVVPAEPQRRDRGRGAAPPPVPAEEPQ